MYLIGCYKITGKLGNFSWLSCVYCYIGIIIRLYRADGVWLVLYTLPSHKYLYRPKFPLIFLRIYLLIIESIY